MPERPSFLYSIPCTSFASTLSTRPRHRQPYQGRGLSSATEQLSSLAQELQRLVGQFRIASAEELQPAGERPIVEGSAPLAIGAKV